MMPAWNQVLVIGFSFIHFKNLVNFTLGSNLYRGVPRLASRYRFCTYRDYQ